MCMSKFSVFEANIGLLDDPAERTHLLENEKAPMAGKAIYARPAITL